MGTIAPHEANEVRLVLAGLKPLATIEKGKDAIGYSMAVALSGVGMLASECRPTVDCPKGEIVFTKPVNKALLVEYKALLSTGIKRLGIKNYHRALGKLFGYSSADIEEFISSDINCNCTKCRGY